MSGEKSADWDARQRRSALGSYERVIAAIESPEGLAQAVDVHRDGLEVVVVGVGVDLHALTVIDRPGVVGEATLELAAMLYAIGLDPPVAAGPGTFVQELIEGIGGTVRHVETESGTTFVITLRKAHDD